MASSHEGKYKKTFSDYFFLTSKNIITGRTYILYTVMKSMVVEGLLIVYLKKNILKFTAVFSSQQCFPEKKKIITRPFISY